jgi:DNA-directed RNA polymerase specialized sigma24 family protein
LLGQSKTPAAAATAEGELWRLAVKKLVVWTVKKHRMNPADAEQVVQEAIRLFLRAGGQADPNNPKALIDGLGSNINGIAVNRRRKKAELAVRLTADGTDAEPDDPPDAEQRLIDDQIARKAISAILERVKDDQRATEVVMMMSEGIEDPADQAKAMGCDVREVYNARRRLKTHVEAIKQRMETW